MSAQMAREHAMNPLKRTEYGWGIQDAENEVYNEILYFIISTQVI